jgi:hypothetical protein
MRDYVSSLDDVKAMLSLVHTTGYNHGGRMFLSLLREAQSLGLTLFCRRGGAVKISSEGFTRL